MIPQRGSRFAPLGVSSCHGSISSAIATFASQSRVGLVSQASTAKSCERETLAKSASAVKGTRLRFAAVRTFLATSSRSSVASTGATVGRVCYPGVRYTGLLRAHRSNAKARDAAEEGIVIGTTCRVGGRDFRMGLALFVVGALAGDAGAQGANGDANRETLHDIQQYNEDALRLKSSCADIAELERRASTVGPKTAIRYHDEAARRRDTQVQAIKTRLVVEFERAKQWTRAYFAAGDTPDGARSDLAAPTPRESFATMRSLIDQLRCYEPDAASEMAKGVDGLAANTETMIADETKCRATPACIGPRMAANLCQWIADRRSAAHDIQTEKKNPAGVVDLVKLHDLGEAVQTLDAQIASGKAQFAKTMSKPFTEAACTKGPTNAPR